jgi:hypothetical protein
MSWIGYSLLWVIALSIILLVLFPNMIRKERYVCNQNEMDAFDKAYREAGAKGIMIDFPPDPIYRNKYVIFGKIVIYGLIKHYEFYD